MVKISAASPFVCERNDDMGFKLQTVMSGMVGVDAKSIEVLGESVVVIGYAVNSKTMDEPWRPAMLKVIGLNVLNHAEKWMVRDRPPRIPRVHIMDVSFDDHTMSSNLILLFQFASNYSCVLAEFGDPLLVQYMCLYCLCFGEFPGSYTSSLCPNIMQDQKTDPNSQNRKP